MLKKLEMTSEILNNYGYTEIATIGVIGLLIIRYFFKRKNKEEKEIKKIKPLTDREELIERLTDYELKRMPNQSRKEARKLALERWERDRR